MAVVGEQHYSNFQASPIETRNALKDALDKVCIAPVSPTGSNNVSADNRADVKQALQQWLDQAPSWKTGYALLYTLQCRSKTSEDFDDSPEGIDDLANGIYDVHENSVQRAKLLHELGKELGFRTYLAHALSRRVRHRREHESLGLFNENSRRRITKEGISNGSLESSDEKTHEVKNIYTFEGKRILAYFTVRWRDCVQRFEPKGNYVILMIAEQNITAFLVQSWIDESNGPQYHDKLMRRYLKNALKATAKDEKSSAVSRSSLT